MDLLKISKERGLERVEGELEALKEEFEAELVVT